MNPRASNEQCDRCDRCVRCDKPITGGYSETFMGRVHGAIFNECDPQDVEAKRVAEEDSRR